MNWHIRKINGLIGISILVFLLIFIYRFQVVNASLKENFETSAQYASRQAATIEAFGRKYTIEPYRINPEMTAKQAGAEVVIDVPVTIEIIDEQGRNEELAIGISSISTHSFSGYGFNDFEIMRDTGNSQNFKTLMQLKVGESVSGIINIRVPEKIINRPDLALTILYPTKHHVERLTDRKVYLNTDEKGNTRAIYTPDGNKGEEAGKATPSDKEKLPMETALAFENAKIQKDGKTMYRLLLDKEGMSSYGIDKDKGPLYPDRLIAKESVKYEDYYNKPDNTHYIFLHYKDPVIGSPVESMYKIGEKNEEFRIMNAGKEEIEAAKTKYPQIK
ncbi:hypothetical protein [Paenibacillus sp. UNC499MF]|uniref:hypothetical protein n=1 Tax=Paenibacillus sp. UNC499MF TaxID=1502751 RepID=UPI0008A0407E|nr:hypothetical protein [Paenibacillus sp. UNC499MF]SEG70063.1 hypothetical protein SAMN02799616_04366 [Paenibacillus sp. UNC499MF]